MEVGVDIEQVSRFGKLSKEFIRKVYTRKEIDYCSKSPDPKSSLAGRFCAKEAVLKALRDSRITLSDIEVLSDKQGKLAICIKGKKKGSIHCSISHSGEYAVAFAIVEK